MSTNVMRHPLFNVARLVLAKQHRCQCFLCVKKQIKKIEKVLKETEGQQ